MNTNAQLRDVALHHKTSKPMPFMPLTFTIMPQKTPVNPHQTNGFTLVELMVVIVILTVFAGMLTMSVSSGDVRKNMAYQEHLVDSMHYLRLLSQERVQPMGIRFDVDKTGKPTAKVMVLQNPYAHHQTGHQTDTKPKNAMELSGMSINTNALTQQASLNPTWVVDDSINLPIPPNELVIDIQSNQDAHNQNAQPRTGQDSPLNDPANHQINKKIRTEMASFNPWLASAQTPQIVWFGTGESAAVIITMRYHDRPVGETIQLLPNGEVVYGAMQ